MAIYFFSDYSSLYTWESGEQANISTNRMIAIADCRTHHNIPDEDGGSSSSIEINGWTTASDFYVKVWTDPDLGHRHEGKYDETKYHLKNYRFLQLIANEPKLQIFPIVSVQNLTPKN